MSHLRSWVSEPGDDCREEVSDTLRCCDLSPKGPLCCQCRRAFASGPALLRGASAVLIVCLMCLTEPLTSSITRLAIHSLLDGQGFFFPLLCFLGRWQWVWVINPWVLASSQLWNNEILYAQVYTQRWDGQREVWHALARWQWAGFLLSVCATSTLSLFPY